MDESGFSNIVVKTCHSGMETWKAGKQAEKKLSSFTARHPEQKQMNGNVLAAINIFR